MLLRDTDSTTVFVVPMFLSSDFLVRPPNMSPATFMNRVLDIFGLRTDKQMIGVDAGPNITGVACLFSLWNVDPFI